MKSAKHIDTSEKKIFIFFKKLGASFSRPCDLVETTKMGIPVGILVMLLDSHILLFNPYPVEPGLLYYENTVDPDQLASDEAI